MKHNSQMKIMAVNILSSLNSLKNELLNIQEVVIRNLQNDKEKVKTEICSNGDKFWEEQG